jgi:hypothetical protein
VGVPVTCIPHHLPVTPPTPHHQPFFLKNNAWAYPTSFFGYQYVMQKSRRSNYNIELGLLNFATYFVISYLIDALLKKGIFEEIGRKVIYIYEARHPVTDLHFLVRKFMVYFKKDDFQPASENRLLVHCSGW